MELCNDGRRTNERHRYCAHNFGTRDQGRNHRIIWINRSNLIIIVKSFYPLSGLGYETVDTRYIQEFNRDVLQKFVSEFIVYGCRKVNNDIYVLL